MLNSRLALDVADPAQDIRPGHAIRQHDCFTGCQAGRQAHNSALL
jgi:hypothetical protein